MKKIYLVIVFSAFCVAVSLNSSFAGSTGPIKDHATFLKDGGDPAAPKSINKIEVIPDNFGGNLYFYKDEKGNSCVSNSMDNIPVKDTRLAQTEDSASISVKSDKSSAQDPLMLAELEDEYDDEYYDEDQDYFDEYESFETIADPLEPINRIFFRFNDKLYFWLLKPVASGYKAVVPEPARISVRNFFSNLSFPVRFVNCLFQCKFEGAGYEVGRFLVNSTIGLVGFYDVAGKDFNMKEYDEDLGQTLGSYGLGHGFFINWPFLGPSSVRDSIGDAGDAFLEPLYYTDLETKYKLAVKAIEKINSTSLIIGEYEDLKKAALDPYIAYRDAYYQYRNAKTKE